MERDDLHIINEPNWLAWAAFLTWVAILAAGGLATWSLLEPPDRLTAEAPVASTL